MVNSLAHQMKEVLDSGEYPDVQFLVGKEKEATHKAILSSASDVFETMFRYNEQNSKNSIGKAHATKRTQIEDPDIEIEAFEAMLTFIYTMNFDGLDANNWMEVLKAANKYNISGLVKKCADFPIEKLPNVFVAFEQARLRNLEFLVFRCLRYIDGNMSALVKSEAFLQIDQDLLCEILQRDQLRINEIEIFKAALRWADEQCQQNDIECSTENRRKMLGPALFNIRFPLMPKEDFTKSVVSSGVLTTEEVDSIYQHYSHPNLSDAPGIIKLKFPTHRRYKKGETIEMEIEKVSEFSLEEVESERLSDAMEIGGFSWKILVEIKTKDESNEKWLSIFLYNDGPEKETNYWGFIYFISFAELLDPSKGFYNREEDKVKLAIDVIIDEPKTEKFDSDPNNSNGTLSMEIEKLSEFAREVIRSERKSETLYINGLPWKILTYIEKKNENNEKWLGFFLLCDASEKGLPTKLPFLTSTPINLDGNWSRKCSATLRIVSQKSGVEDFKEELDGVFDNERPSWGFDIISFTELMDPSKGLYNKDEDKVSLAIDFTCE
ncbi:hypothetical protein niasHT_012758 [Heterodera trifolii]|uniref:BTB/POZ domain-containing protein n=1 Tax=Heterodera trifolii TaxID=157864 RepID=A0ABD2KWE5_9BILA